MIKTINRIMITLLVSLLSTAAFAQDAGTVTFASGDVSAERQPAVALAKGDTVLVSDTVVTGAASRAQLTMIDGAKIAMRADSSIVINEYVHAAAQPAGSAVSSSDDSSVISLVKGGFRTITGAIGDEQPENYEVRTAVGVLGIRGTDFAVLLGSGGSGAPRPGLHIMVYDGRVVFQNATYDIELSGGEYAFIPLDTQVPERIDVAPPVFIDDSGFRFQPESDGPSGFDTKLGIRREPDVPDSSAQPEGGSDQRPQDAAYDRAPPEQAIIGVDESGNVIDLTPGETPQPQTPRQISYSTGPIGLDNFFSATRDNAGTEWDADANGALTRFTNTYPDRLGPDIAEFDLGTANVVENSEDPSTLLRWGRWSGGVANIRLSDGSTVQQDLTNQSIHWVASAPGSVPPVMPITGVANYTLIGSTSPTDNFGNAGVLGGASFQADFTNMRVTTVLDLTINGSTWDASGTGNIGGAANLPAHMFQGLLDSVSVDGIGGGSGTFGGFFSSSGNTSDPSFPGGVGMTFSMQDPNGTTTVSGAAVFGNP